jgi:hypothetical protein
LYAAARHILLHGPHHISKTTLCFQRCAFLLCWFFYFLFSFIFKLYHYTILYGYLLTRGEKQAAKPWESVQVYGGDGDCSISSFLFWPFFGEPAVLSSALFPFSGSSLVVTASYYLCGRNKFMTFACCCLLVFFLLSFYACVRFLSLRCCLE